MTPAHDIEQIRVTSFQCGYDHGWDEAIRFVRAHGLSSFGGHDIPSENGPASSFTSQFSLLEGAVGSPAAPLEVNR